MQQALLQLKAFNRETCFVSGTHEAKGRTLAVTPENGASRTQLNRSDAVYIPRDLQIEIWSEGDFDLSELSSPVENRYSLQAVKFAEIRKERALGGSINFLGMMAANRESKGQPFGVVNVRPEYGETVLEASQK